MSINNFPVFNTPSRLLLIPKKIDLKQEQVEKVVNECISGHEKKPIVPKIPNKTLTIANDFLLHFRTTAPYNFKCLSNCANPRDADFVFLGETHGSSDIYAANTLLAAAICKDKKFRTLFAESDAEEAHEMIDTSLLSKEMHYECWDDQSLLDENCQDGLGTQEEQYKLMVKIGSLFQKMNKVLAVEKRSKKPRKDALGKIALEINTLMKEEAANRTSFLEYLRKSRHADAKKVKKAKFSAITPENANNPKALFRKLFSLYTVAEAQYTALVFGTMKARQKSLCRTISKAPPSVILGGQDHFICEECGKIEHMLAKQLKGQKAKYVIIYDITPKGKSGNPEVQADEELSQEFDDFNTLPHTATQMHALALLAKKITKCRKLINDITQAF